jgi:DNA (cytosine-5)-methyltransferase 1
MTLGHTESNGLGIYESETANTLEAVSSSNQAVAMRMREGCDGGGKGPLLSEEQSLTLAANTNDQTIFQPMAVTENMRAEVRLTEYANAVTKGGGKPGQGNQVAFTGMVVRRLTPRECERLQGYRDDYTLIPYRGKPAADGPRYKALGNSWAVPVVQWIGRRIEAVELCRSLQ